MARNIQLAVDVGRRALRAAKIRPGRRTTLAATVFEPIPQDVATDDAEAIGIALGAAMERAGLGTGPAVFALDRSITSFKRLELPTNDPDELPEMVQIAVERELPIEAGDAVIDFSIIERTADAYVIEAVAVPKREIERIHAIADAAGLKVARIAPRCHGAMRLADPVEPTLFLDVTGEGLELGLVEGGFLKWSRGVALDGVDGAPPTADELVPEIRRSWLSYRVSAGDIDSPMLLVLGGEQIADSIGRISEATGLTTQRFIGDRRVQADVDMRGVWPLVGLLLPTASDRQVDLAAPRRTPDRAARLRQMTLAAAGLSMIAGGIGWTIGESQLEALRLNEEDLLGKARAGNDEHLRFKRDVLRADHLEAWASVRPAWLEHLLVVATPGIDMGGTVLDEFGGFLEDEKVEFTSGKTFVVDPNVRIIVEGESRSRDAAASVRAVLVADDRYVLRTTGADAEGGRRLPYPFGFSMRTKVTDPGPAEVAPESGGAE
ncbi:MAG: hypothetical protein P8J59_05360 [Phycisphaerales bacterium]|jgi:hypothetical protein|nr:hypothetical protein [Phycisphaerales bacterium]